MKKKWKIVLGSVLALFVLGVVLVFVAFRQSMEAVRDSYAQWDVALALINHMRTRDGAWPKDWAALEEAYKTTPDLRGWGWDNVKTRVEVDFAANPAQLKQAPVRADGLPFRVVWLRNGKTRYWSGAEPNALIAEYLKGEGAKAEGDGAKKPDSGDRAADRKATDEELAAERAADRKAAAAELPQMVGKSPEQLAKDDGTALALLTTAPWDSGFEPWHVWTFKTPQGDTRYVGFLRRNGQLIPGPDTAKIVLLASSGERLGGLSIHTGNRVSFMSAGMSFDDALQAQLITVASGYEDNHVTGKQYIALVADKLFPVRMEDEKGRLIRIRHSALLDKLGEVADMTALLESPQLALRLVALNYLTGIPLNPNDTGAQETKEFVAAMRHDAELAEAFRNAETTKELIEEYRKSENPWLKEAADLAATPPDEHY